MIKMISEVIKQQKEDLQNIKSNIVRKHITLNISTEDFKELFILNANKIIANRNIDREFEVNENNKGVINQIFYYCIGDKKQFNGDLQKGIMISGNVGVGKTIILQSYCDIINQLSNKKIRYIHSKKLQSDIRANGFDNYEKRPLFIDDIGKEAKEVNDFGTIMLPIVDLIALRYDNGALTFTTCNYKLDTLSKFYGTTTTDRMKEMFNIIELTGESLRK